MQFKFTSHSWNEVNTIENDLFVLICVTENISGRIWLQIKTIYSNRVYAPISSYYKLCIAQKNKQEISMRREIGELCNVTCRKAMNFKRKICGDFFVIKITRLLKHQELYHCTYSRESKKISRDIFFVGKQMWVKAKSDE